METLGARVMPNTLAVHPETEFRVTRATDAAARDEWRELGFFVELNEELQQWRIAGSRAGVLSFRDLLVEYAARSASTFDSAGKSPSSRVRFEITIWPDPEIDERGISGSLDDLRHLAAIVERKLSGARPGDRIRIGRDYAPASDYVIALDLRVDDFDPASEDHGLRGDG